MKFSFGGVGVEATPDELKSLGWTKLPVPRWLTFLTVAIVILCETVSYLVSTAKMLLSYSFFMGILYTLAVAIVVALPGFAIAVVFTILNARASPSPAAGPAVVVAVWEHRYRTKKGMHTDQHRYFSNGHLDSADGPSTWKKTGSTLILYFRNSDQTCTISEDGQSFEGHGQHNPTFRVSGNLISGNLPQ